jgi:hypothetical protein
VDGIAQESQELLVRPVQEMEAVVIEDPIGGPIAVIDRVLPDIAGRGTKAGISGGQFLQVIQSGQELVVLKAT